MAHPIPDLIQSVLRKDPILRLQHQRLINACVNFVTAGGQPQDGIRG